MIGRWFHVKVDEKIFESSKVCYWVRAEDVSIGLSWNVVQNVLVPYEPRTIRGKRHFGLQFVDECHCRPGKCVLGRCGLRENSLRIQMTDNELMSILTDKEGPDDRAVSDPNDSRSTSLRAMRHHDVA